MVTFYNHENDFKITVFVYIAADVQPAYVIVRNDSALRTVVPNEWASYMAPYYYPTTTPHHNHNGNNSYVVESDDPRGGDPSAATTTTATAFYGDDRSTAAPYNYFYNLGVEVLMRLFYRAQKFIFLNVIYFT